MSIPYKSAALALVLAGCGAGGDISKYNPKSLEQAEAQAIIVTPIWKLTRVLGTDGKPALDSNGKPIVTSQEVGSYFNTADKIIILDNHGVMLTSFNNDFGAALDAWGKAVGPLANMIAAVGQLRFSLAFADGVSKDAFASKNNINNTTSYTAGCGGVMGLGNNTGQLVGGISNTGADPYGFTGSQISSNASNPGQQAGATGTCATTKMIQGVPLTSIDNILAAALKRFAATGNMPRVQFSLAASRPADFAFNMNFQHKYNHG